MASTDEEDLTSQTSLNPPLYFDHISSLCLTQKGHERFRRTRVTFLLESSLTHLYFRSSMKLAFNPVLCLTLKNHSQLCWVRRIILFERPLTRLYLTNAFQACPQSCLQFNPVLCLTLNDHAQLWRMTRILPLKRPFIDLYFYLSIIFETCD